MSDLLLQFLCLTAWLVTVPFIYRQARQIQALRGQLAAYVSMREKTAGDYQRTVDALMDCSRGLNATLHEHDRRLRMLSSKQEQFSTQEGGGTARYREAVDLLRRGADEDDLIGSCGLSRGEAHLIAHLERLQNRVA
jgi:hypothetical protein